MYYPIKACRGFEAESAIVERMGLEHDRRMMVVTPEGRFITQREHHTLALVTPTLKDGIVTLSAPGFDSLQVAIRTTGVPQPVDIWHSKGVDAIDQGEDAAAWFSDWLGTPARLVHIADGFKRKVNPEYAINGDDHTGFADGYPILITSEESLADLNARLETPVPMNRFRPNIVEVALRSRRIHGTKSPSAGRESALYRPSSGTCRCREPRPDQQACQPRSSLGGNLGFTY